MVFVRDRSAKQGEDSIVGGLNDVAIVAMDRVDHQPQCRINDCPRLLGIKPPPSARSNP